MNQLIGQFLLAFREALEAALITAIILAYLKRTGRSLLSKYVWYGVYVAMGASVVIGIFVWLLYGSLTGSTKALFEGVAALFAVFVISSMIYWMASKGRELRNEVEQRVKDIVTRGATLALTSFSFIVTFREGLETVLFLTPFLVDDAASTFVGAFLGVVGSIILAYAMFVVGMRINMHKFFYFTSILLVLLAGGLVGYGVHELVEYTGSASWGWLGQPAYNLNIPSDSAFHHKGVVGSVFAVMFGYTVNAEWARVLVHLAYLAIAIPLIVWVYRKK
ncbi:MAG: FTR1 family protein [Candidatus Bathyarchaeota archaeon]|nr:FTR1 family protein [Candidatus Bathyarchaeota archaeon]